MHKPQTLVLAVRTSRQASHLHVTVSAVPADVSKWSMWSSNKCFCRSSARQKQHRQCRYYTHDSFAIIQYTAVVLEDKSSNRVSWVGTKYTGWLYLLLNRNRDRGFVWKLTWTKISFLVPWTWFQVSCAHLPLPARPGATISFRSHPERRRFQPPPSPSSSQLVIRRTRLSTVGDRAFPVAGCRLWNSLPPDVTSASKLTVFRNRLKTYLFSRSFPS